jgi:hypothetical protein
MKQNIGGMRDAVRERRCVAEPIGCGRQLSPQEIASWDYLTAKEYTQSGWCKTCQDKVFKDPDEVEECTHEGTCEEWSDAANSMEGPFPEGNCICSCDNPCWVHGGE